jgi:hypothetical protein
MTGPKKETSKLSNKPIKSAHIEPSTIEHKSFTEKDKPGKDTKTRIVVHFDCGFGNALFIRGEGISTLSWNKGSLLKNCGPKEWMWETERPFSIAKFKILLNDHSFEKGENHALAFGNKVDISPAF